ncbi:zinc finger, CCHC-type containing protein [Tanacetum coccineum]
MGDKNPIRNLGDYSRSSHEASNWLERLPAGSISTWEDLTTRFLAQFFLPGRTAKLHNDILMFQQHQEESLSKAWTRFKDLLQKVPHHGIDLWLQVVSEKLDDTPTRNTAGNPTAQMNFASTNDPTKEELRGKGIKSPSKLLSPKYLSQSSLAEQNRNLSSLKHVHFVNSIIILNKEDGAKEEENVKSSATKCKDYEMRVESEEEFEEENEEETKEKEEDNLEHFDAFPTMKEL